MESGPAIRHSPRKIARLPETLINQIAAGEVVERPASVVKELIENSLDAGATRIDVLLTDGGTTEITVIDDGCGMEAADLALCLERHTTSKLAALADLDAIATYGFRGEALSSIASVAELELKSRPPGQAHANRIVVHYGEILEDVHPTGAPVGTAITIRHLFERLPARQKFLRSVATELSHAARTLREVALGCPHAAFYLYHQGKKVAQYTLSTRAGRLQETLRPDWEPLVIREEAEGAELEALLSPPTVAQDRGELFLYINGRAVRNRGLVAAARNGYLNTLGPHHEPTGVIHLDMRRDWVDVNVHPQKLEVRCLRQETLYQWIQTAVRKAIAREIPRPVPPRASSLAATPTPLAAPDARDGTIATAREKGRVAYRGRLSTGDWLAEDERGVLVIDPRALALAVRFAKLREAYAAAGVPSQRLLSPRVVRVPGELEGALEAERQTLARLGLELEPYGGGDVLLRSHPEAVGDRSLEETFVAALRALRDDGPDAALFALARAGVSGDRLEGESLLGALDAVPDDWTTPDGRPVALRISHTALQKHFERTTA